MITIHESGKAPIFLRKAPKDLTQYTPAALRHTLTSLESDRFPDKAVVRGAFVNLPQYPMQKKGAFQFNDESIGQRLNVEDVGHEVAAGGDMYMYAHTSRCRGLSVRVRDFGF